MTARASGRRRAKPRILSQASRRFARSCRAAAASDRRLHADVQSCDTDAVPSARDRDHRPHAGRRYVNRLPCSGMPWRSWRGVVPGARDQRHRNAGRGAVRTIDAERLGAPKSNGHQQELALRTVHRHVGRSSVSVRCALSLRHFRCRSGRGVAGALDVESNRTDIVGCRGARLVNTLEARPWRAA